MASDRSLARRGLRALLLLCAANLGSPFVQIPRSLGCTASASAIASIRRARRICTSPSAYHADRVLGRASASGHDSSAADAARERQGRPPARLPPAGASTFWDRARSSPPSSESGDAGQLGDVKTEVLVLGTSRQHTSTVIWLHGNAGDPPRGWLRAVAKLNMPWCKFLLPVAASFHPGTEGPCSADDNVLLEPTLGWNDHDRGSGMGVHATEETPESLWGAVEMVHDLIDREAKLGIEPDKVVVGGFGQGAAVALLAALTYPRQLAGVASLCGYLPAALLGSPGVGPPGRRGGGLDVSVAAAYLPVLMCHGSRDAVVPVMTGLATYKTLASLGTHLV